MFRYQRLVMSFSKGSTARSEGQMCQYGSAVDKQRHIYFMDALTGCATRTLYIPDTSYVLKDQEGHAKSQTPSFHRHRQDCLRFVGDRFGARLGQVCCFLQLLLPHLPQVGE
jgi:hypothetical protein